MIKDPVCGIEVEPAAAMVNATFEGQEYFFCSPTCKTIFEQDPQRFVTLDSANS